MGKNPIEEHIRNVYEHEQIEKEFDVTFMFEWQNAKSKVIYKLLNKKRYEKVLADLPHKIILDLVMVFYIALDDGKLCMLIENPFLKNWNISVEELEQVALENTPQMLPPTFKTLDEFIGNLKCEQVLEKGNHYILTNEMNFYGAGALLYPGMIEKIATYLQSDFYVIPSNVNDVLIWPKKSETEEEVRKFVEVIQSINEMLLGDKDLLSKEVYVCSKDGSIRIYECGLHK